MLANGLEPEEVAASTFRVYARIKREAPDWAGLSLTKSLAWMHLVKLAVPVLENHNGLQFTLLAEQLYAAYASATGLFDEDIHKLDMKEQIAWNVVGRHLANLVLADNLTVEVAEAAWPTWLADKYPDLFGPHAPTEVQPSLFGSV